MRNAKEVKLFGLTTLCLYHFPASSPMRAEAPVITDTRGDNDLPTLRQFPTSFSQRVPLESIAQLKGCVNHRVESSQKGPRISTWKRCGVSSKCLIT